MKFTLVCALISSDVGDSGGVKNVHRSTFGTWPGVKISFGCFQSYIGQRRRRRQKNAAIALAGVPPSPIWSKIRSCLADTLDTGPRCLEWAVIVLSGILFLTYHRRHFIILPSSSSSSSSSSSLSGIPTVRLKIKEQTRRKIVTVGHSLTQLSPN